MNLGQIEDWRLARLRASLGNKASQRLVKRRRRLVTNKISNGMAPVFGVPHLLKGFMKAGKSEMRSLGGLRRKRSAESMRGRHISCGGGV